MQAVLADPIGSYFAARSFAVWFQPRLAGAFVFGELHPADEPALATLLVSPVLEPGYDLLCDCGTVEKFDERGFALLSAFLDSRSDLLRLLRRFAFVRPAGLAGAGFAGLFYERVQPILEAGLFADRSEALDWLGYDRRATERAEIEELVATVYAVPVVVRRLREFMVAKMAATTLGEAASALAMSERSLQRELAAAATSFRDETTRVRVRLAESLLATSDEKIESIARRLGFASVPAFTTMFGRAVGESPHEFRERRRSRTR